MRLIYVPDSLFCFCFVLPNDAYAWHFPSPYLIIGTLKTGTLKLLQL